MYYVKELKQTINGKSNELSKENDKLINSYYTVKYNYDKESDTLLLSDLTCVDMEDSAFNLKEDQIKKIMPLPYNYSASIDEVSNEEIYYLSMSDFLTFASENNISMIFPSDYKFLSFMNDKYLLDRYFEIKGHSKEGYILLRQTVNKNYATANQALSCFNLINLFKENNHEEDATVLYDYLSDELNGKDYQKIK